MSDSITAIITAAIEHAPGAGAVVAVYKAAKPFLEKILGPAADELGEEGRSRVKDWRTNNTASTAAEASKMLVDAGVEPQPIPPKVLLPLLEAASLEDNGFLRTRWAALLANAANPQGTAPVETGFVKIMEQVTPVQVSILDALYSPFLAASPQHIPLLVTTDPIKEKVIANGFSAVEFEIGLDNLVRLRLCTVSGLIPFTPENLGKVDNGVFALVGAHGTANIGPTKLGAAFLIACTAPGAESTANGSH